jgi:hypothetical protein
MVKHLYKNPLKRACKCTNYFEDNKQVCSNFNKILQDIKNRGHTWFPEKG